MAEWDRAADRLNQQRKSKRNGGRRPVLSAAASREAQHQRQAAQQRVAARARVAQQQAQRYRYMESCERNFGLQPLSRTGEPLTLRPTSIHGEGDKIALPPSVLEYLTSIHGDDGGASPWMFRMGIRNPEYVFPASPLLQTMALHEDDAASDHGDDEDSNRYAPFIDEVHRHMYRAITHGSVVEFTQDEGSVGLPAPMAAALIAQSHCATMRTVDPAMTTKEEDGETAMQEEEDETDTPAMNVEETTTPGHLAWGAFDLPDCPIEITLVQHLPKGRSARLRPSPAAVQNGFYGLQDIKLVLEQSLIRTRATLSLHDTIRTWHRGKQFDLQVVQVEPSEYGSVSCINTDIEVEFAEQETSGGATNTTNEAAPKVSERQTLGGGRRLDEPSASASATATPASVREPLSSLPAEPPTDSPTCITIQLRFPDGTKRQHRFDIDTATIGHVWAMATTTTTAVQRLVTRFPRRVWTVADQASTLRSVGLQPGQELVLVER